MYTDFNVWIVMLLFMQNVNTKWIEPDHFCNVCTSFDMFKLDKLASYSSHSRIFTN